MFRITLLLIALQFSYLHRAQNKSTNSLLYPKLVVSDIVPLDSVYFHGFGFAKNFHEKAYFKIKYKDNFKLNALLINKVTNSTIPIFENFSPYKDVYFEKYNQIFVKRSVADVKKNLGELVDTIITVDDNGELVKQVVSQPPDTTEIKGLLFFDEWNFDEEKFSLTKKVLSFCPVRRYVRNKYEDENGFLYRKVGYYVFPELKRRKLKKIEKRMKYIARVEYEYPIESRTLFNKADSEMALYTEDYDSPNWNSYARLKFRNLLIDKAISNKHKVYDFITRKEISIDEVKRRMGYEKNETSFVDPQTGKEKLEIIESEIIRDDIKSFIFIEDWFIDSESMRMKKEVIGAALVRYYDNEDYTKKLKKAVFCIYFNKN